MSVLVYARAKQRDAFNLLCYQDVSRGREIRSKTTLTSNFERTPACLATPIAVAASTQKQRYSLLRPRAPMRQVERATAHKTPIALGAGGATVRPKGASSLGKRGRLIGVVLGEIDLGEY
jgi:hypothetical protein